MNAHSGTLAVEHALTEAVYESATEGDGWASFLACVSDVFHGQVAMRVASCEDLRDVRSAAATLDPEYLATYYARYGGIDPFSLRDRQTVQPDVVVEEALLPLDELARTEFYADWMAPQKIERVMRWRVRAPEGILDLMVMRDGQAGAFTETEQALSYNLLPHIRRAVGVADRLGTLAGAGETSLQALDRMQAGVLLVDSERRIRFTNATAEQLLTACDGLKATNGRLHADGGFGAKLAAAIAAATLGQPGRSGSLLSVARRDADLPLSVAVTPFAETRRGVALNRPLAMIVVTAPELRHRISIEALRSLFDLTPAEARLVAALCAGESLASYAVGAGAAMTTVKTHLAAAFRKTGERRQADLVLRIMSDPALRIAG